MPSISGRGCSLPSCRACPVNVGGGQRVPRRPEVGLTHCTGGGITGYDHAVRTIHILTTAR